MVFNVASPSINATKPRHNKNTLKPDPFEDDLRKTSTLSREGSIGVGGEIGSRKALWGLQAKLSRDDSLESIGEIAGFGGNTENDPLSGNNCTSPRRGSLRRSDSDASSGPSDGKKRVSFHKNVKAGKHEPKGWYSGVIDNFADMSLQKCTMQCGNSVKALDSVLSEVQSCTACGNFRDKNRRCAHCGLSNQKCDTLGEENDLVWKPSEELRDVLYETRDVIQESRDAIVATKVAVNESRDAILGSYDEMRESRAAILESRHAITDCRDVILRARPDPIEQQRLSQVNNMNVQTGTEDGMNQGADPFSNSMHANQKVMSPRSILKKKKGNNLVITARKSTAQMDMYGAASALPNSPGGQVKKYGRRVSSRRSNHNNSNTEGKATPGRKMKRGVTRMIAGGLKAPLKFMAHRMSNSSSARPKRVLAIKSGFV